MIEEPDTPDVVAVRALLATETRRLLGATISLDDASWRQSSDLPGWTRAHVTTHLARNADALRRLAAGALAGTDAEMYPDDRDAEIEAGAGRPGAGLQTDLDRSAEELDEEFDRVDHDSAWPRLVRLRGGIRATVATLPAARLTEVVLHHVDLDIGYQVTDIETATAVECLHACARRFGARADFPALRLVTESAEITVGNVGGPEVTTVIGPANRMLGWLAGRSGPEALDGASVELPGFG